MIKNIGNSFIGGFFRRLGSIFALFFILALIGYLLKDLDSESLINKLLGIQKVDALALDGTYIEQFKINNSQKFITKQLTSNNQVGFYSLDSNWDNVFTNPNGYKYALIPYTFSGYWLDKTSSAYNQPWSRQMTDFVYRVSIVNSTGAYSICEITDNYVICPLIKNANYIGFRLYYNVNEDNNTGYMTFNFNYDAHLNLYNSANSLDVYNAVNGLNQTQEQTNNKLDETNQNLSDINDTQKETNNKLDDVKNTLTDNTLNDNEVSNELSELAVSNQTLGFFTTFLTLPLTWVQNILRGNQTCSPLVLPLPYTNKDLSLPCMSEFWQNMGILGTLLQAVWLAVVGVRVFNGLFVITVDSISSKGNVDELTKIRSWEL